MTPDDLVLTPRGVRFQGQLYPCTIGKTGITRNKREGDKATPAGIHRSRLLRVIPVFPMVQG